VRQAVCAYTECSAGFGISLLTAPFLASVCVVLYFDRRIRAEALDVQLVADRLAIDGD
jgi:hypothetical protein